MLPTDAIQFGQMLKKFRGRISIRCLVDRAGGVFSRSQLSRFETGMNLPRLEQAGLLDALYQGGGWIENVLHNMYRTDWNPVVKGESRFSGRHFHRWPGAYAGVVWVFLCPGVDRAVDVYRVRINWGPWLWEGVMCLGERGRYIWTGKAEDSGEGVTMNIEVDHPVFALFGMGDFDDVLEGIDIQHQWKRR